MSYIEKCNPREDFEGNSYKPNINLIVIVPSDSNILLCFSRYEVQRAVTVYDDRIDEKGNVIKGEFPVI
mgnify:FL=1